MLPNGGEKSFEDGSLPFLFYEKGGENHADTDYRNGRTDPDGSGAITSYLPIMENSEIIVKI